MALKLSRQTAKAKSSVDDGAMTTGLGGCQLLFHWELQNAHQANCILATVEQHHFTAEDCNTQWRTIPKHRTTFMVLIHEYCKGNSL